MTGGEPHSSDEVQVSRPVLPVALVIFAGLLLTLGVLTIQRSTARSDSNQEIAASVSTTAARAAASLASLDGSVTTLAGWLSLDGRVSEATFTTLAERAIGQRPDLDLLEYAPVVRHADRAAFEAGMAARGHTKGVTEMGPDGLIPAARRDVYLPLDYVAPAGDTMVHGFDAFSREPAAVRKAVAEARTVIGDPVPLVEDGELGLISRTPVFDGDTPTSVTGRQRAWKGVVIGVLRLDAWATEAALAVVPEEVGITIRDSTGEVVWANSADAQQDPTTTSEVTWRGVPLMTVSGAPGPESTTTAPRWRSRATAVAGLVLTFALALATWKSLDALASRRRAEASEQRSRRLQVLAQTDPLTGLLHREGLRRWLDEWLRDHPDRPLALVFIDIKNFREINAAAGHIVGDLVLERVGHRLSVLGADADTAVGRMGGDQFIVLRAGDRGSLPGLVSVIQTVISEPLQAPDMDVELVSALGVSYYPDDGADLNSLMQHADLAVQEAKKKPGNSHTYFHPALVAQGQRRRQRALALRMAMRDPDEHFLLEYQPQVDIRSGRVVGAEALLRWRQPDGRIEHPDAFLHLATQQGLMPELGEWVLDRACRTLADWPDDSRLVVAVNVDTQQIRRTFTAQVKATIARTGIDPGRLTLEVTEAAAMDPGARAHLEALGETGVGVAIDDFGTGFSSLSRLTEVPATELKIDRVFVRDLCRTKEALDIVQAIHALAMALGMSTIAEGVETADQASTLLREGVLIAQGYLYSPPVSNEEFLDLYERGFPILTF